MTNTPISGAEIRRRRHTLGFTLEGLSAGICSTAYLSLIEQEQRIASPRIQELLLARLSAIANESGVAVQISAMRVADWEVRQTEGLSEETRQSPALRTHQLYLDALEAEARGERGTALAMVETWLSKIDNSRDLLSYGARMKVRLLRELGRDAEALKFGSELLIAANQEVKSRHDDLLEIAFQTAELYSAAGLWKDALRVIEAQRTKIVEPRQKSNSRWAEASAFYMKGDFGNALLATNEAIEVMSGLDLPSGLARLTNNAVFYELCLDLGDPAEQTKRLEEAIETLRSLGQGSQLPSLYTTYARLAAKTGDKDAFKSRAATALALSVDTHSRTHDEFVLSIAEVAASIGEDKFALEHLALLDSRTRKIANNRGEALLYFRAGKLAEKLGDIKRAYAYLSASHAVLGFVSIAP
jgi:hypothetical protein